MGAYTSKQQARAEMAARRRKVAALYLRKMSQEEIAGKLGVDQSTVSRDITFLRKQWAAEAVGDMDTRRGRELAELEEMERDCILRYTATKDIRWHTQRLKVKERIARLLGLDAPARHELTGAGGGDIIIKVSGGENI